MRRDGPATSPARIDDGIALDSRERCFRALRSCIRGSAPIAIAVLVCFASEGLRASTAANPIPGGLTVHRSMRAAPHRLIVHPNDAVVAANQTQRFGVTDAQGNPVAVHWNVSGIGCSGEACGTIDEHGIYQPPSSLPQPRFVTIEGVLVSDPNYSVLTEVRLADVVTAPAHAASPKPRELAAPVIESQSVAARSDLPALPQAVNAPPGSIERHSVASRVPVPALPNAVAAAPAIGSQHETSTIARNGKLPALPSAIAASPTIEERGEHNVSHRADPPPLPQAVTAAPIVQAREVVRNGEFPPLPGAVAATPAIERQNVSSRGASIPLPNAVSATPAIERQDILSRAPAPPPKAFAAPPQIQHQEAQKQETQKPESPKQEVQKQKAERSVELTGLSNTVVIPVVPASTPIAHSVKPAAQPELMASASPAPIQIHVDRTPHFSPPLPAAVGNKNVANKSLLPAMQDAAIPAGVVSGQHSPVTYLDGQLTIDSDNLTLAAVLELVAQKTGAVIEVPSGTGQERIIEHAGPGRPEDVIASLLNGSPFDFVIVGSPLHEHAPTQVLLSLHTADDKNASLPPQPPVRIAPPAPWTPPPNTATVVMPADLNGSNLEPPKEPLPAEVLGQMMKERTRQLREQIQQQIQQQQ
jgi:hypothetical protein